MPEMTYTPKTRFGRWVARMAGGRYALEVVALISFAESSFFPIPTDIFLVPLVLANPSRWKRFAFVVTVASVLGGLFGYFIGWGLYDIVAEPLLLRYDVMEELMSIREDFDRNAFMAVFLGAFTPLPYKLFTIAAGVFQAALVPFIIASTLGRGIRYYIVAYLCGVYGKPVMDRVMRYFDIVTLVGLIAILVYFLLR